MNIRQIASDELHVFAHFSGDVALDEDLAARLAAWWRRGASGPHWCFVAEEEGRIVGRLVYWAQPPSQSPTDIVFLSLPWDGDYHGSGEALLRRTLALFQDDGLERIAYQIDIPSRLQPFPEKQGAVLEQLGFSVLRDGDRWEWLAGAPPPIQSERLVFRTLSDVGEDVFVDAIARVSEGSLDGWIAHDRARLGPERAAREYFSESQKLTYRPAWWQLAYTGAGALAGLVMMAHNSRVPVVDYIGVVPEQRGHGFAADLLAHGTSLLAAEGVDRIEADTDKNNLPMARTFERLGYRRFCSRRAYGITLRHARL
jgi:RimJ/RimL family protein N-acetyltransferase